MNPDQKNKVAWITNPMTDAGEIFSLCFLFTGAPPSPVPASQKLQGDTLFQEHFHSFILTLCYFFTRFIHTYQSTNP